MIITKYDNDELNVINEEMVQINNVERDPNGNVTIYLSNKTTIILRMDEYNRIRGK